MRNVGRQTFSLTGLRSQWLGNYCVLTTVLNFMKGPHMSPALRHSPKSQRPTGPLVSQYNGQNVSC